MLSITDRTEGNKLTVALQGRLDTSTAPELETFINAMPDTINEMVYDLKTLDYMSSAGLRIMLATHKKMAAKGGLTLINVSDEIMEVFSMTAFDTILNIQ